MTVEVISWTFLKVTQLWVSADLGSVGRERRTEHALCFGSKSYAFLQTHAYQITGLWNIPLARNYQMPEGGLSAFFFFVFLIFLCSGVEHEKLTEA